MLLALDEKTLGLAVLAVLYVLYWVLERTDIPQIKNLPQPRGVPILGNLLQLGDSHAQRATAWSKSLGPVFQARLGNRRVVFANSFEAVRQLWIGQQSALISRPTLHTFHSVVSSSAGFTIGTSPWDESCKRRRKAAATALNRPAVQSYMPIIDLESTASMREMIDDTRNGNGEIDPIPYFQRYALNTSLTLNYGIRIGGNIAAPLLREIVHVEREISNLRSTSNNWQDYIPLLRILPGGKNKIAGDYRQRRDVYMNTLLDMLKAKMASGEDKPCITGNILKDPEAKLDEAEIMSICLTMVSAGLDTVPGNLIMSMAYLSSPHGQEIQARARTEIARVYPNGDAWSRCLSEEKVEYVTAFVKETLRYWTVIPICLPRVNIREIEWQGARIPAGTTFLMNAYGADYDPAHFASPEAFDPGRYLKDASDSATGTPHYGYGAGSRMCVGSHLANRELYTAFLRIFVALDIMPPAGAADAPVLHALECNAARTSLTTEPKPFKVKVRVRNPEELDRWLAESDERTKDL